MEKLTLPEQSSHPGPGRWWWFSFYDPTKAEGSQFLGVAIVEGAGLRDAIDRARTLGINPGGRVASVACTRFVPVAKWRNRLLSFPEAHAAGEDLEAPA